MIDFSKLTDGSAIGAFSAQYSKDDLRATSDALIDRQLELLKDAGDADVVFQPSDPEANDTYAADNAVVDLAWTLGHVVVHATASSEEGAAVALTLARGIETKERSRYETPWEEVTTIAQVRERLEESRRMRNAMFDAWPAKPNLAITQDYIPRFGPMNAVARCVLGLWHEHGHVSQIEEILRQARAAA